MKVYPNIASKPSSSSMKVMSTINVQVILQQEIQKGTPHIQMYNGTGFGNNRNY
jgi:hypothetical protein